MPLPSACTPAAGRSLRATAAPAACTWLRKAAGVATIASRAGPSLDSSPRARAAATPAASAPENTWSCAIAWGSIPTRTVGPTPDSVIVADWPPRASICTCAVRGSAASQGTAWVEARDNPCLTHSAAATTCSRPEAACAWPNCVVSAVWSGASPSASCGSAAGCSGREQPARQSRC